LKSEVDMNILKNALLGLSVVVVTIGCVLTSAAQQGPSTKVQYYSHQQVAAAFAKGAHLVEGNSGHAVYQVLTARRDGPGEVEVHALDTDVFYVVKGSATFVTGGKVVDGKKTAPNEVRGKSIEGGMPHHLSQGDILIIPHGIPHWFKAVQPPFLYLVVKVH
jgi:mannose-6-phosphate isomerase-like protein (cupin superfamily)